MIVHKLRQFGIYLNSTTGSPLIQLLTILVHGYQILRHSSLLTKEKHFNVFPFYFGAFGKWEMRSFFNKILFSLLNVLFEQKKLCVEWRIWTCMSETTTSRGLLLPLHTKINLLGGIHLHREWSNSIFMDHYKAIQQQEGILSVIGKEKFWRWELQIMATLRLSWPKVERSGIGCKRH